MTNNGTLEMWLSKYFRTSSSLAQIFNDMLPLKLSARKGAPRHADEHEQPRNSTLQPGQVQRGRRNEPTDARTSRESAREGAPTRTNEYEQPRAGFRQARKVRRGRGDIPKYARTKGEGAREGAPINAVEYERPRNSWIAKASPAKQRRCTDKR